MLCSKLHCQKGLISLSFHIRFRKGEDLKNVEELERLHFEPETAVHEREACVRLSGLWVVWQGTCQEPCSKMGCSVLQALSGWNVRMFWIQQVAYRGFMSLGAKPVMASRSKIPPPHVWWEDGSGGLGAGRHLPSIIRRMRSADLPTSIIEARSLPHSKNVSRRFCGWMRRPSCVSLPGIDRERAVRGLGQVWCDPSSTKRMECPHVLDSAGCISGFHVIGHASTFWLLLAKEALTSFRTLG